MFFMPSRFRILSSLAMTTCSLLGISLVNNEVFSVSYLIQLPVFLRTPSGIKEATKSKKDRTGQCRGALSTNWTAGGIHFILSPNDRSCAWFDLDILERYLSFYLAAR